MLGDRGISISTTTSDGKEYVAVFLDPVSSAPTYTYIIDNNKKENSMTNKIELITAIEENRLLDFVVNELKEKAKFHAYDLEVVKTDENHFQIVQSTKYQWHYNDVVIAEGTAEECARLISERFTSKPTLALE